MDTSLLKKSLVTVDQLHSLLDFMKEHPDLAKGLRRGRRGKLMTLKIWAACAKRLNALKPGAVKDGKGWSKYWCDWKYRVRRRALELKAAKDSDHTPPEPPTPLSDIEETIINIIGESSLEHVVIKTNPLDEDSDDRGDQNDYNDTSERRYVTRTKRKRKFSSRDQSDADDHSEEPCSPPKIKSSPIGDDDIESEDEASQFLSLERQKLDNSFKIVEALQSVTKQLERLTDTMLEIKDKLLNKLL